MQDIFDSYSTGFNKLLGMRLVSAMPDGAEMELDLTPDHLQPHGFLHGGVTLALLETTASAAACANADLETQLPFGVAMNVHHRKPGVSGTVRAVACLEHQEISTHSGALKQVWHVEARDEAGDVLSEGIFESKIVSKEYFAQKRQHDAGFGSHAQRKGPL
jgi:1,4-dihydroxy-2-naphthoyl-CoA hydrolase